MALTRHSLTLRRTAASAICTTSSPLCTSRSSASAASLSRGYGRRSANRLPQQLASDPTLRLAELLNLPTFKIRGDRFYHRLTFVVVRREITQVYYPVTIPGRHAMEVLARLQIAHWELNGQHRHRGGNRPGR